MTAAMTPMKWKTVGHQFAPPRRAGGRRALLQLGQRQIGHDALAAALLDDHLVGALEHLLHGFEEQPLARHVRRLGIFVVDRDEALRLTLRLLHDAVLVGGRLFADLRGLAAGLAEQLVRILVRFLDEAVLVLFGALHFVERVGHFARRRRVLDRDRVDRQSGAVLVERRLDDLAHRVGYALAVVAEDVLRRTAADHFAHRAFADLPHHLVGIGDVEQIGLGIGDLIGDGKLDVDDVLVARKHQARRCVAANFAEIDELFGGVGVFDRLDRPPMEMQARLGKLFLRLAEPQLDGQFVGLDGVDRLEQPERDKRQGRSAPNSAGLARPPPGSACFRRSWPRRMMSSRSGGEPCGPLGPRGPCPHGPPLLPPPHGPPPPLLSFQGMNVLSVSFKPVRAKSSSARAPVFPL